MEQENIIDFDNLPKEEMDQDYPRRNVVERRRDGRVYKEDSSNEQAEVFLIEL